MSRFETKTPPNMIEFRHTSLANDWVMRITADRRIEVNEGVKVNDAAKKVLEAMQHMLTPQRKPLTDAQIHKASTQAGMQEHYMGFHSGFIRFARAIEAAHGIKE